MNQTHTATAPSVEAARKTCATVLGTLADLGSSWALYGLKVGKMALETSAETLGKTAHTLDVLASELDKKAKAAHHEAETDAAPPAPPADAAPQA
jgi:hypothetical protein